MMSRVAWWKKLTTQQKIYIILHCLSLALSPFHMNFWFFIFVKCVTLFSKTQQLRQQLSSPSTVNSANKHIFMLFRCKIFAPFSCVGGWNRWRKYSIFKIAVIIKNDISQLGERRKKKFLIFRHVIDCWCSGEALLWGVLLGIHEKCFPIFSSVHSNTPKKKGEKFKSKHHKRSVRVYLLDSFVFSCHFFHVMSRSWSGWMLEASPSTRMCWWVEGVARKNKKRKVIFSLFFIHVLKSVNLLCVLFFFRLSLLFKLFSRFLFLYLLCCMFLHVSRLIHTAPCVFSSTRL